MMPRRNCAVLLVDHVTKDAGNPRFAIGGMMKLAAVDEHRFKRKLKYPSAVGGKAWSSSRWRRTGRLRP